MLEPTIHDVSPPIEATVLLVDLRNFTPNLNAAKPIGAGINHFCHFLSQFYAICLDACLIALPRETRNSPPLYMSSTGDGVLIVLHCDEHVRYGFLATLTLNTVLQIICNQYNQERACNRGPTTSFGIGVETGPVSRVRARPRNAGGVPLIDTYIGECINVAARAEATSKLYDRSNTIIAQEANERLTRTLFSVSYNELIERALREDIDDNARLEAQNQMNEINRALCVTFMHHHNLKGVDAPMPLFRLSHGAVQPGNPRFDAIVDRLTEDNSHCNEIFDFFQDSAGRLARLS